VKEPETVEAGVAPGKTGAVKFLLPVQVALTACAVLMSVWARIPWLGTVGLGLLGATAVTTQLFHAARGARVWRWVLATAWACTLVVPATLLFTGDAHFSFERFLDQYYAVLAWLIAAAVLPVTLWDFGPRHCHRWRLPVLVWAFFGSVVWLATAYAQNQAAAFYVGVLINVALLILWKGWCALPGWTIQFVNTLLLILVGFPLVDLLFHPANRLRTHPDLRQRLYSYEAGKRDPLGYATWWEYYLREVDSLEHNILMDDPARYLPYRLKPGSDGMLFQSHIVINSLGFRGPEIPREKGTTYRIVVLGESTTFGITLDAQDRPWPELLEQMLQERLKLERPVQVINAGVPGYNLDHNLFRFASDILPLHPDLVVSYHGINGFPMLNAALPSNLGPPPPRYKERPVRFLADCEFRLNLLRYRRRHFPAIKPSTGPPADPSNSIYAAEYRHLIALAHTNDFRLAVGNFSMAVNAGSDPKIVSFYRLSYPYTPALIEANALHSRVIQELAPQYPDVCFVDTHPHLDGECGHFLDPVHFAPSGDRQLAENFFAALRPFLEHELTEKTCDE
jgi:lysophospholipase L1-like esterase